MNAPRQRQGGSDLVSAVEIAWGFDNVLIVAGLPQPARGGKMKEIVLITPSVGTGDTTVTLTADGTSIATATLPSGLLVATTTISVTTTRDAVLVPTITSPGAGVTKLVVVARY